MNADPPDLSFNEARSGNARTPRAEREVRARRALQEIVARHGPGLAAMPERCAGLLADTVPGQRREIGLLVGAAREGAVRALLAGTSSGPSLLRLAVARASQHLVDATGFEADGSRWAVESWAVALNLATEAELQTLTAPEQLNPGSQASAKIKDTTVSPAAPEPKPSVAPQGQGPRPKPGSPPGSPSRQIAAPPASPRIGRGRRVILGLAAGGAGLLALSQLSGRRNPDPPRSAPQPDPGPRNPAPPLPPARPAAFELWGHWTLRWFFKGVQHDADLQMKGTEGRMRVEVHVLGLSGLTQLVDENLRLYRRGGTDYVLEAVSLRVLRTPPGIPPDYERDIIPVRDLGGGRPAFQVVCGEMAGCQPIQAVRTVQ